MNQFRNIILPGESRRRQLFYLSKSKLSHVAQLASFMAGFAIRSVVNLQINEDPDPILLTIFVVVTSLLVATSSFVILITLWMLPLIKTAEEINEEIILVLQHGPPSKIESFDLAEFADGIQRTGRQPSYKNVIGLKTYRTNVETVRLIEIAWILAGTVSVLLFMMDVVVMYWIKFEDFTWEGPIVSTALLACVIIGLGMFGLYFRIIVVKKFRNITKRNACPKNSYDINKKKMHRDRERDRDRGHASSDVKCTRDNSLTSDLPPEPYYCYYFREYANNSYVSTV